MSETLGLKNINMLSKEQFEGIEDIKTDELYAISGSGAGFPSSRYDELELGATGAEYTAPANGWFYLSKGNSGNDQYCNMNVTGKISLSNSVTTAGWAGFVPVKKGDKMKITYNLGGAVYAFRFIYAEGE